MRRLFGAAGIVGIGLALGCSQATTSSTTQATKIGGQGQLQEGKPIDDGPPPPPWTADMQAIADGNNKFACDLYAKLAEKNGNVFFSPYSVHTALSMTATGAKDATREQMLKALHLPTDAEKLLAAGDLGAYYTGRGKPYELAVANALWGNKEPVPGGKWRTDWLDLQQKHFRAGFREADFRSNPDGERARINHWVAEQTRDKIKNVLGPTDITNRTAMVLANAIYFKGDWVNAFEKSATRDQPFHLADGSKVNVPLMHTKKTPNHRYAEFDGFQVLEMPYKGGDLSMVVVLPRKADGLRAVEKQLTGEALAGWVAKLHAVPSLLVYLPRFRTEQRFDLPEPLKKLGMVDGFQSGKANLRGMADLPDGQLLWIDKVVHKAFVDVNEEGAEAAAFTGVMVANAPSPPPPPPVIFRADRPFAYLIRDAKNGTVLFLGRYEKP